MTKGKLRYRMKMKTGFLNITVSNVMMEWTAGIKVIMVTLTRLDWVDWRVLVSPLLLIQRKNKNWTFNNMEI